MKGNGEVAKLLFLISFSYYSSASFLPLFYSDSVFTASSFIWFSFFSPLHHHHTWHVAYFYIFQYSVHYIVDGVSSKEYYEVW